MRFNEYVFELDRAAQFVLNVLHAWEVTGDDNLARELLPACRACVEGVRRRDVDRDRIPEGWCMKPARTTGVGSCASCSYIGDSARNDWKDFGAVLFFWDALNGLATLESRFGDADAAKNLLAEAAEVRAAAQRIFWNRQSGGYLAWINQTVVLLAKIANASATCRKYCPSASTSTPLLMNRLWCSFLVPVVTSRCSRRRRESPHR